MKTSYSKEKAFAIPRKAKTPSKIDETYTPECTIPLVKVDDDVDDHQHKYLSVKRYLPVTAGDDDSPTYEKYVLRFEQGSP